MLEPEEERAMKMVLEDGIVKTKKIMEGNQQVNFTIEEYQRFHQCVFNLHSASYRSNSHWLLERFVKSLEESINSVVSFFTTRVVVLVIGRKSVIVLTVELRYFMPEFNTMRSSPSISSDESQVDKAMNQDHPVLPSFMDKHNALLLRDLDVVQLQDDDKVVIDLYLNSQVFKEFYVKFQDVAISLVYRCLEQEAERAERYMPSGTQPKLLKVVKQQLVYEILDKLVEKQRPENCGLVTDFYQEMLSKCDNMTLQEGSSWTTEEWLSALLASSLTRLGVIGVGTISISAYSK
ncbi:hypothetical protein NC651_029713 [Populus alba x Populus x berolinensis]|nr:hypothetical protein NC651_029713 [Populus alba x Populus x berolinensis]